MSEAAVAIEEKPITDINEQKAADSPEANEKVDFLQPGDEVSEVEEENEEKKEEDEKKEGKEEEDDDESSSDEEMVGLFDEPVQIMEGKRQRKSATKLTLTPEVKHTPVKEYAGGKGVKLGEVEYIENELRGENQEDLVPLYKLCFGSRYIHGKRVNQVVRRDLKEFSGFDFERDSDEWKKKDNFVYRFNKDGLKYICGLLGVDIRLKEEEEGAKTTKTKLVDVDKMRELLMTFLLNPSDTGYRPNEVVKPVKTPTAAKPKAPKRKSEGEKAAQRKRAPKKKKSEDGSENTPTPVRIAVPKKKKTEKTVEDSDEEDDVPLVKKKNNEPSDDEIRTLVELILKDANLEEVTMKIVCRQVYDTYPNVDLLHRKDFIKNTVKEIIQSL